MGPIDVRRRAIAGAEAGGVLIRSSVASLLPAGGAAASAQVEPLKHASSAVAPDGADPARQVCHPLSARAMGAGEGLLSARRHLQSRCRVATERTCIGRASSRAASPRQGPTPAAAS